MSVEHLRSALDLGKRIEKGSVDLWELDRLSLKLRGKSKGGRGGGERNRGDDGMGGGGGEKREGKRKDMEVDSGGVEKRRRGDAQDIRKAFARSAEGSNG